MNSYDGFGFGLGGAVAAGIDGAGGLGGFGYGGGYLMMPLNYNMQIIQQIELNDMIRISNYSFEMHDNVLRVFPIPGYNNVISGSTGCGNMWVEFMLKSERASASIVEAYDKIKMVSGVPYKNPKYALSILVEHGGNGSTTAAPMAKELFKLIIDRHSTRRLVSKNYLEI